MNVHLLYCINICEDISDDRLEATVDLVLSNSGRRVYDLADENFILPAKDSYFDDNTIELSAIVQLATPGSGFLGTLETEITRYNQASHILASHSLDVKGSG